MHKGVTKLNSMGVDEAKDFFLKACGSRRWADAMIARRSFADAADLFAGAEAAADSLARDDWLEAFSHHPRIGDTNPSASKFVVTRDLSRHEQSGMSGASEETRRAFVEGNRAYEAKFGHVFLICATGKSGEAMLEQLRARLANDAETELRNAASEQRKITRLRLERMLSE